jgi:DnaK suppressor protein
MRESINRLHASSLCLKLLVAKQAELLAELRSRRQDIEELREPVPEEDQAAVAQESSVTGRLSAIESGELSRVNAALEKLRCGTYGNCDRCGSLIPEARLKAIPWAEHCCGCEAQSPREQAQAVGGAQ